MEIALLQKVIIGQDATGDRILDGHDAAAAFGFAGSDPDDFPEGSTRNDLDVFAKKLFRGHLVEATFVPLYGDFEHILKMQKSRFLTGTFFVLISLFI